MRRSRIPTSFIVNRTFLGIGGVSTSLEIRFHPSCSETDFLQPQCLVLVCALTLLKPCSFPYQFANRSASAEAQRPTRFSGFFGPSTLHLVAPHISPRGNSNRSAERDTEALVRQVPETLSLHGDPDRSMPGFVQLLFFNNQNRDRPI